MYKIEQIISIIESDGSDKTLIRMHDFPDPDSIASAYGLQRLLKDIGNIESVICYQGIIDNHCTDRLVRELGIETYNIDDIDPSSYSSFVILVDTQNGNSNLDTLESDKILCIDHHPIFKEYDYLYSDIKQGVGACSSIIANYFYEAGIVPDQKIATALLYGIKIDTANLTRGVSRLDLYMYYLLYGRSNLDLIHSLESCKLMIEDLSTYTNAFNSIEVHDNIVFANTGSDSSESLMAKVADFIVSINTVELSVVYSVKASGIKVSVRSVCNNLDAGRIANISLEEFGSGGGHRFMAGGFVSFSDNDLPENQLITKIKDSFIKNRF